MKLWSLLFIITYVKSGFGLDVSISSYETYFEAQFYFLFQSSRTKKLNAIRVENHVRIHFVTWKWYRETTRLWVMVVILKKSPNKFYVSLQNKPVGLLDCIFFPQVDVSNWHRNIRGENFRPFVILKKLEACKLMEYVSKYPSMVVPIDWMNLTFPGLIHKCPFKVNFVHFQHW